MSTYSKATSKTITTYVQTATTTSYVSIFQAPSVSTTVCEISGYLIKNGGTTTNASLYISPSSGNPSVNGAISMVVNPVIGASSSLRIYHNGSTLNMISNGINITSSQQTVSTSGAVFFKDLIVPPSWYVFMNVETAGQSGLVVINRVDSTQG